MISKMPKVGQGEFKFFAYFFNMFFKSKLIINQDTKIFVFLHNLDSLIRNKHIGFSVRLAGFRKKNIATALEVLS